VYKTSNSKGFCRSTCVLKHTLAGGAAMGALLLGCAAFAQEGTNEIVYVTGYRASLESALNVKRNTTEMVDAITAEDIGKFPDSNLAESLQRLPGVAVDRDNGEGRTITVRGLGSNFTRVTLNGLQALSTAGASDAGSQPNRDRGFDFNTFASELFSELKVQKSASAATEDGSLGATIDLSTPHPLNYGEKFVLSAQNAWYEMGKPFNPRISGLVSETFFGGKVGVLVSAAYTLRSQFVDQYARSPGQSDFAYRGSDFKYSTLSGFNNSTNYLMRNGFAAPAGTSCNGTVAGHYAEGVIPGNNITYAPYCAALSGSNPTAYALINTPQGWALTDTNTGTSTSSKVTAPGSTVLIPALPSLTHQQLYQQRIGMTTSVQWQPDDDTLLTFDGMFSSAYQDSINYQISSIGLNRNNTNNTLNTGTVSAATFTTCAAQTGSATQADIVCGRPKNQDPYPYYTSSAFGYSTTGSDALAAAISFVGRPSTKLIDAKVQTGTPYSAATYLKLDNVDFRSGADQAYYTVQFSQLSLNATHTFSERFKVDVTAGWSHSYNHQTGILAELNHMDNQYATTGQYFIWDDTAGGEMPAMNFGFDVANPANWTFVKNFSALRHYEYYTDNKYRTLLAGASLKLNDYATLQFGANLRIFDFVTSYYQRAMKDVINPSFQEAGVTTAAMSQVVKWGKGLSVPAGTPTSFVVPNLGAYEQAFGFTCNCINDYGDWRLTNLFNPASTGTAGQTYNVSEHSRAFYGQLDIGNVMIFGNELRGNVGARFVTTEINSVGHALQGQLIFANHTYNDLLPSANLVYALGDDMLIRAAAAKVIARPDLSLLAPSITAMSIPSGQTATTGATMSMGNPSLNPYRAKTVDIGWEWYFDKGAVLAVTGFAKWVSSQPTVVVSDGTFSSFLTADQINVIKSFYAGAAAGSNAANQYNYINNNYEMQMTQALNGPGGVLKGIEITYEQHLDFIPAWFGGEGFGVNANYTKIESTQDTIINSAIVNGQTVNTMGSGRWIGASPDAWNLTLYYDGENWSTRVSSAFRSGYVYRYPIAGGSDQVGYGNAPLVNDFWNSKNTFNVDLSASYDVTENIGLTLDALNLTNQPDRRWAYQSTPQTAKYASTGRQVFVGFRIKN
jgi:iron complex outermembrane recepter protein